MPYTQGGSMRLGNIRAAATGGLAAVLATALITTSLPATELHVSYLNVGQADATLLQGPACTMLIDAGRHNRSDVVDHLHAAGVESIDYLVGTHPHADHIGQFSAVLAEFPVDEIWMSGWEHTTLTFERALDAILDSDAGYHEPRAGEREDCGALGVEVLLPTEPLQDIHDGIALRVTHGDVRFLFTGDAEAAHEEEMLGRGGVAAEVLQLGHHGSRTSTTRSFLDAVSPDVGIYSAGEDNSHGHPHDSVIARLTRAEIPVYGTPVHGTVVVVSDGERFTVTPVREQPSVRAGDRGGEDTGQGAGQETVAASGCVDLNRASAEALQEITHIGEDRAAEIKSRRERRPFDSVGSITRVHGIGPARANDIKDEGIACVEAL